MSEKSSHRDILRSTSIIGGASALNIVVGLLRAKVAAVLLGPAGVGIIGLLQSLLATSATVAGFGLNMAGTRQVAEAVGRDDESAVAIVQKALLWGTVCLALFGGGIFWALRGPIAAQVLGDPKLTEDVGWLAIGLALTVGAGSQTAVLNGRRRIGDLARVTVFSSIASTVAGIAVLLWLGQAGVIAYVLIAPVATFLLGHLYVARVPKAAGPAPIPELRRQWSRLVALGGAFMFSGLSTTASQLAIRTLVKRELGDAPLGCLQAASMIATTYIAFVLQAMGTDYYPRLTAAIGDRDEVNRMVNDQTETALLLAAPVFITMIGFAPWIISLLYTSKFAAAASLLQWQISSDVLKIASWPLGFILLAAGDGKRFVLCECLAGVSYVSAGWLLLPVAGLDAAGLAMIVMYALYLIAVFLLAVQRTGFMWRRRVAAQFGIVLAITFLVIAAAHLGAAYGAVLAGVTGASLSIYAYRRLGTVAELPAPLASMRRRAFSLAARLSPLR